MRLLVEVLVIGGLIYLGWEKPFRDWLPGFQRTEDRSQRSGLSPAPINASAAPHQPFVRSTSTPSGDWMWDPAHHSTLDRPAYNSRDPSKRYWDSWGRKYWIDAKGVRHYDQ